MVMCRSRHVQTLFDGRIVVTGGESSQRTSIFDPVTAALQNFNHGPGC